MPDQVVIEQLELSCQIGITEEERAAPQRLTVSLTMLPMRDFSNLRDDVRNVVDYHRVAQYVQQLASAHPRRLVETLGVEIAEGILLHFPVAAVDLHLRKYILPDTASVGVQLRRERGSPAHRRAA